MGLGVNTPGLVVKYPMVRGWVGGGVGLGGCHPILEMGFISQGVREGEGD